MHQIGSLVESERNMKLNKKEAVIHDNYFRKLRVGQKKTSDAFDVGIFTLTV